MNQPGRVQIQPRTLTMASMGTTVPTTYVLNTLPPGAKGGKLHSFHGSFKWRGETAAFQRRIDD